MYHWSFTLLVAANKSMRKCFPIFFDIKLIIVLILSSTTLYQSQQIFPLDFYDILKQHIDYSYHIKYNSSRQFLHNSIVQQYLGTNTTSFSSQNNSNSNWIIFTAGTMGSGKSYTLRWLAEHNLFPLVKFLLIDFDVLRLYLPETAQLYYNDSISISASATQKEVGYLVELITLGALFLGRNVLVDGSLKDHEWYSDYFRRLRSLFPSLRLGIFHNTAPLNLILARAESRAKITGRYISSDLIVRTYEMIPHTIELLSPLVDYHCTIWNENEPVLISSSSPGKDDSAFKEFRQLWINDLK